MKRADLIYDYPEALVATQPSRPSRVLFVQNGTPAETTIADLVSCIPAGDVFVINNTKVLKRRIFINDLEILFLDKTNSSEGSNDWSVLFPSKKFSVGDTFSLPNGSKMTLLEKGRPQKVRVRPALNESDFNEMAELPLPPYIQKARGKRHAVAADESWYQTAWAEHAGSFAAPTASLHFSNQDIQQLKTNGVHVVELTLHVGLGTFLPVLTEDLDEHTMHEEFFQICQNDWELISKVRSLNKGVWSLGTTSTRVLETVARTNQFSGRTDILLQVGSEFKVVNRLLTNFHQPESTLLALVAGFTSLAAVKNCYSWAIERKFKLFSYGDLSVWIKN